MSAAYYMSNKKIRALFKLHLGDLVFIPSPAFN